MTILICGASSLVGRDLCKLFDRENMPYDGTYYRCKDHDFCKRDNMFHVDFTKPDEVREFFIENKERWRVCIFLVTERNLELCERDWGHALHVNVEAVDTMSSLCAKDGIYFIHLSTDSVFDGCSQPNFPNSQVNPIHNYGMSKLLSELRIQRNYTVPITLSSCLSTMQCVTSPNYCIIRTPSVYTNAEYHYNTTVTTLARNVMDLRAATRRAALIVDNYDIQRPVFAPDLCIFIRVVATVALDNMTKLNNIQSSSGAIIPKFTGIYHFYNPDNRYTKYEMTKAIAEYMGLSHFHIIPHLHMHSIHELTLRRPQDPQLIETRYNIRNYFTHTFVETIPHIFSRYKHPKIIGDGDRRFLMFNLDGTLVHTSYAHYRSYTDVFQNRGLQFMSYSQWNTYIKYKNIRTFLEDIAAELAGHDFIHTERILSEFQNEKLEAFRTHALLYVTPTKNALDFLRQIADTPSINAVIYSDGCQETVDIICSVIPELRMIKNWSSNVEEAKEQYYRKENYVIGFENTAIGYDRMHAITPIVYLYIDENEALLQDTSVKHMQHTSHPWYETTDAFLFDDFRVI